MQTVETGMAFVYDDYGRLIAYVAGVDGRKDSWYILYRSIKTRAGESVYTEKSSADDENGLPVYDKSGPSDYERRKAGPVMDSTRF